MPSSTTLAVFLVALSVLSGCTGAPVDPSSPTTSGTPTATQTTTTSGTPTATTTTTATATTSTRTATTPSLGTGGCPGHLSLDRIDSVPDDVTVAPYGGLSTARQAEFDATLSGGTAELDPEGPGYDFWVDRPYVRYDDAVYRAVVAVC